MKYNDSRFTGVCSIIVKLFPFHGLINFQQRRSASFFNMFGDWLFLMQYNLLETWKLICRTGVF